MRIRSADQSDSAGRYIVISAQKSAVCDGYCYRRCAVGLLSNLNGFTGFVGRRRLALSLHVWFKRWESVWPGGPRAFQHSHSVGAQPKPFLRRAQTRIKGH